MSIMLSIFGPTLALYLLGLVFYTAVETARFHRRMIADERTLRDAVKNFDIAA